MARRDQSLADDLDVGPGRVSTRVALLLRGAERKPVCPLDLINTPHQFRGRHARFWRGASRGRGGLEEYFQSAASPEPGHPRAVEAVHTQDMPGWPPYPQPKTGSPPNGSSLLGS